jgi:hypothetical protein
MVYTQPFEKLLLFLITSFVTAFTAGALAGQLFVGLGARPLVLFLPSIRLDLGDPGNMRRQNEGLFKRSSPVGLQAGSVEPNLGAVPCNDHRCDSLASSTNPITHLPHRQGFLRLRGHDHPERRGHQSSDLAEGNHGQTSHDLIHPSQAEHVMLDPIPDPKRAIGDGSGDKSSGRIGLGLLKTHTENLPRNLFHYSRLEQRAKSRTES